MDTSVYVKSFITSTHYRRIAALPKDTPFTCSSAEIRFNVRNVTLVSKQICLKQLKSITSQTAPPKWRVLQQLLLRLPAKRVARYMFDLTLHSMSDMRRLKANTSFFLNPYGKCVRLKNIFQRLFMHYLCVVWSLSLCCMGGCWPNTNANTLYCITFHLKRGYEVKLKLFWVYKPKHLHRQWCLRCL